jgi:hypothetical protein
MRVVQRPITNDDRRLVGVRLPRPFALFLTFSECGNARKFRPIPRLLSQNFKKPKDIPHPRVSAGRMASGRQSEL